MGMEMGLEGAGRLVLVCESVMRDVETEGDEEGVEFHAAGSKYDGA